MSDDELPQAGAPEFDDEDSDDGAGPMGDELPEGVKKEIITEADGWKKPREGDEVSVHYVGTLESDGSEFDSSRSRGKPFVFTLGQGQVIKGWDLGVATMKKGEVAKFTLAPEFAYGEDGSPPKIPASATLVFEVELISWVSKDDLFGDDGVIKTQSKEGSGWKTPKHGDEVLLSLQVTAADNSTVIEERSNLEYVLGSDALGALAKACDKALNGMKKGEEACLKCSKEYAYGDQHPDGVTVTLTLLEIYETKDVSFNKDKSMMKKQIGAGEGYEMPKDGAKAKLSVEAATDGSATLAGFSPQTLEFVVGNGEVCDALECVVCEMKKGEKAVYTVSVVPTAADAKLGLQDVQAAKVVFTLELIDFEKAKDTWNMSEEEKVEFGNARKEVGTQLFKSGRLQMALGRYKKVAELVSFTDNFKEENKANAKALKLACESNKAACFLKLRNHVEAKAACKAVLKEDPQNVKAVYRLAQAELGLKNFLECIADCKRVVELDPQNKEARALLKQAQAGQKDEDKKAKGLFANMCKALGKGPIPEPGKSAPLGDFGDDDGDEDEEEQENEGNVEAKEGQAAHEAKEGEAAKEVSEGDTKMVE